MRYGKFVVAIVIFLSACATTANYEKILNTWVGGNVDNLVSSWGPPANFYTFSDGGRVLEYSNQRNVQIGGYTTTTPQTTYQTGSVNAYGYNVGSVYGNYNSTSTTYVQHTTPIQNISMQCVTTFTVNPQGIITKWAWQGNACKAMAPDVSDKEVSDEDVSVTSDSHANAPLTEYEIAQSKYKAKDFVGAFAIYKRLAEAGDTKAEQEVGKMYYSGQGITRDPTQAFHWWKKLADNGNKIAQRRIAIMYEMGDGVEKNQSEADAWHKRAKASIDVYVQPALKQSLIEGLASTVENKAITDNQKKSTPNRKPASCTMQDLHESCYTIGYAKKAESACGEFAELAKSTTSKTITDKSVLMGVETLCYQWCMNGINNKPKVNSDELCK